MKHPTSRLLHAYWDRLRGERAAPERSEIEPGEIRSLLADSMILEVDAPTRTAGVRLAGTRICALYGRELKGSTFSGLWGVGPAAASPSAAWAGGASDTAAWELVDTVAGDTVGVVSGLTGFTERDETVELELLLLPLRHRGKTQARMLGALSPALIPPWLGHRPIVKLETKSQRVLGGAFADGRQEDARDPDLPVPANDPLPARRGHLLIHKGGLA